MVAITLLGVCGYSYAGCGTNCIGQSGGMCIVTMTKDVNSNSGTNGAIRFWEDKAVGGWVNLDNPSCDDFVQGETDYFFIESSLDLGFPRRISLDTASTDGWDMTDIAVYNAGENSPYMSCLFSIFRKGRTTTTLPTLSDYFFRVCVLFISHVYSFFGLTGWATHEPPFYE